MGLHLHGFIPGVLYVAGIIIFFVSAFKRPEVGLYFIVPLLPLQTLRFRLHEFPLGAQWVDLILLGVMIGVIRKKYSVFGKSPLRWWLLAFAVVSYIALWRGTFFINANLPLWFDEDRLSDWKNYMVIYLLFFLTLASIRNVKQMQVLLLLMCISITLIDRSVINTMKGRDMSTFSDDIREGGPMGYTGANGLAALEAQFTAFLMGLYSVQKKIWPRLGYLALIGTGLVTLMYTFSRGGYLAVLAGACCVGLLKNRKILVLVAIFLVTWQALVPNAVKERVVTTKGDNGELEPSAGDRITLWQNAVEIIKSDPIVGTGYDTYKYMHAVGPYSDTHNYYIKVLLELGLIGMLIFLGILSRMFMAGFQLFRAAVSSDFMRGLGLGVIGMLIAALVNNAFGDRWTYIEEMGFTWVLVAMAVRCKMILDEQSEGVPNTSQSPEEQDGLQPLGETADGSFSYS